MLRPAGQGHIPSRPVAPAALVPLGSERARVRGFLGRPRRDRAVSVWMSGGWGGWLFRGSCQSVGQDVKVRPAVEEHALTDAN